MSRLIAGKVKEGYVSIVENVNRHRFSPETYVMMWIEDEDDGKEKPILMTENDFRVASSRGEKKSSMAPSGNRLFSSKSRLGHMSYVRNVDKAHRFEADGYYFINARNVDGEDVILAFTRKSLEVVVNRTAKNQEDIVKKSFLTDVID